LSKLFSDEVQDDMLSIVHDYLTKVGEDVRNGSCPLEKFIINKGLTKNPEDYADVKNQPHVQVALAMKAKGIPARVGDTIPFVIVVGADGPLASRAQHPDELRKPNTTLKIGKLGNSEGSPLLLNTSKHSQITNTTSQTKCFHQLFVS
jgi:DNA polymerase alpha subunit A